MSRLLASILLLPLTLTVGACSNEPSRKEGEAIVEPSVIGAKEEGADSSGSMYYIPDDVIDAVAEKAKNGDNIELMRIINHYRLSYEGDDKEALSEKWEKIAADRSTTVPLRGPQEAIEAMNKNVPVDEVDRMEIGKKLRVVAVDYFRTLLGRGEDCSVLKKYAENAKRASPNQSKEISAELDRACKGRG